MGTKKLKNSLANKGSKPWNIRETQGIAYVNDNKKPIIYQSFVTSHNKIKHHKNLTILDEALLKEKQKNFIENKQKMDYKKTLKGKSRYSESIYYKEPIKKKSIRVKKNGITMENNIAKRFEQEILLYKKTLNSYNKIKDRFRLLELSFSVTIANGDKNRVKKATIALRKFRVLLELADQKVHIIEHALNCYFLAFSLYLI